MARAEQKLRPFQFQTEAERETGEWVMGLAERSARGIKAFYHTREWAHKRAEILRRDHNACCMCRERGKYSKATTVHHVQHLRVAPYLALTDGNLISLCESCHAELHKQVGERGDYTNEERW